MNLPLSWTQKWEHVVTSFPELSISVRENSPLCSPFFRMLLEQERQNGRHIAAWHCSWQHGKLAPLHHQCPSVTSRSGAIWTVYWNACSISAHTHFKREQYYYFLELKNKSNEQNTSASDSPLRNYNIVWHQQPTWNYVTLESSKLDK